MDTAITAARVVTITLSPSLSPQGRGGQQLFYETATALGLDAKKVRSR